MSTNPVKIPLTNSGVVALPSSNMLALMLAGLAMLGPFSVDTYLPAFPNIETSLGASLIQVQQTF